ncbi:MAG: hypothetical protein ACKO7B_03490, partial [Flavobacteriales bacterium]
ANDECVDASLITNTGTAGKIAAVSLTGGSVTSGSSTLTVTSTASLGAVGSQWVLSGPFVDPNTVGTVASATTLTLSAAATGTGSGFAYIARQNTYAFVSTGAATASGSSVCSALSTTTTPDDDVWYKFVATAAEHTVAVVGRGGFDPAISAKAASCAASALDCINSSGVNGTELLNLTGLTIGQTYYFVVYHAGVGSPIGSPFDVSVYTPLPLQYQFAQSSGTYS